MFHRAIICRLAVIGAVLLVALPSRALLAQTGTISGKVTDAATAHLAARGLRVLALEQHALGHGFGSSHGLTRIIRLAYFEDPSYVPLLRRAFALWRELQDGLDEPLLHVLSLIHISDPRDS